MSIRTKDQTFSVLQVPKKGIALRIKNDKVMRLRCANTIAAVAYAALSRHFLSKDPQESLASTFAEIETLHKNDVLDWARFVQCLCETQQFRVPFFEVVASCFSSTSRRGRFGSMSSYTMESFIAMLLRHDPAALERITIAHSTIVMRSAFTSKSPGHREMSESDPLVKPEGVDGETPPWVM